MAPLGYKSSLSRYRRYLLTVQQRPLWKASLFVILSLVLIIVLVFAALRPTLITIAGLVGQIEQQKAISEQLDQKIRAVSAAQQILAQSSEQILLLDQALPVEAKTGEWAQAISTVASQSGITITGVSLRNISIQEASRSADISFSITANGPYDGLKSFLQILESLRRLISIESVQLTKVAPSDSSLELVVEGLLGQSL